MSKDWVQDIADMHEKYGVNKSVVSFDKDKLKDFLDFRWAFLQEELQELRQGLDENDGDLVVDSLIDLIVVALGTLDAMEVNPYIAWDRVLKANLNKSVGVKPSRPNPLGLPDLIKNEGWIAPEHHDNLGLIEKALGS